MYFKYFYKYPTINFNMINHLDFIWKNLKSHFANSASKAPLGGTSA
jgi:hypothetical protein